uniref:hypothetical protein n=1 Tax=Nocardiopsis salina TaxID=245836 RepID=UPI00036BB728
DGSYSVEGGAGHIALDTIADARAVYAHDADLTDFDVTCEVRLDTPPRGEAGGATYLSLAGRTMDAGGSSESGYRISVAWRVDAGRGPHIVPDISRMDDGTGSNLTPVRAPIPGMEYTPGEWVRVRAQAVGPELRIRVWPDGSPEPEVWHAQAHDTGYEQGAFGFRATITNQAFDTDPSVISVRDLRVRNLRQQELPHVVRFTGEVSSWPSRWDVADVDVTAPIEASGILRRLGQGSKPIRSVTRRAVPSFLPVAYWPMEEGRTARFANSPTPGVEPMRITGLHFSEDDSLDASRPLPTVGASGATMSGPIPYVDALGWEVHALVHFPDEPEITPWTSDDDNQADFLSIDSTEIRATADFINIGDEEAPSVSLRWRLFSPDGDEISGTQVSASALWGGWRRIAIRAAPNGTSTEVSIRRTFVEVGTTESVLTQPQSYSGPPGAPTAIMATIGPELEGLSIGHVVVWGSHNVYHYMDASAGWDGETARLRLTRMANDFDVPVLVSGIAGERLGPEQEGTFLDVVEEATASDLGSPGEDRASLALTYRGRDQMYNAKPALILDYAGGEISPPMEPEDDDQALRNDVEVQRSSGIAVQVEDTDGPLGVARVGRYDESVTLSLATDSQVDDQAGWRLRLGTVDELRWPVIHLNLANPRLSSRVEDVLALDAGDRVRILNPPEWTQERALDLIVQGYEEHIGLFQWEITLTCTPASPWQVGKIGEEEVEAPPDAPMRADTAGAEIDYGLDETETLLIVSTTRGPAWVTSDTRPGCFPFDITVGGEIMRVTGIVGTGESVGQSVEVERAINDVVKTHAAGTAVRLAYPATAAL